MHVSHWTFLDFIIIVIILVSTFFALRKGLVREIISLVALIGGFLLAAFYYKTAASWFMDLAKTEAVANLVGFLAIFIFVLLVGTVAALIVNRFLKAASLAWIDRILGGLFGFLRGWAVASIIALALVAFPVRQNVVANSLFAPYLLAGARAAVLLVPEQLKAEFHGQYQKILQAWNNNRSSL